MQSIFQCELSRLSIKQETDTTLKTFTWFKNWLGRQKNYTPQPYEQLASVLQNEGYKEKAKEIIYESKEQERKGIKNVFLWIYLTILKYSIGYGYYLYRVLYCMLVLSIIGVCFIFKEIDNKKTKSNYSMCFQMIKILKRIFKSTFYSLDKLIPFIHFDKQHDDIKLSGISRYYFFVHSVIGFILSYFFIAGITGLTK